MEAVSGLHVVYGSRTRRGLNHANEDRHAVAGWLDWRTDAHLLDTGPDDDVPRSHVVVPLCTGSARKDTTVCGSGATGTSDPPFPRMEEPATPIRSKRKGEPAFLWTVCDGHDGPEAADFVCRKVGDMFSRVWHAPLSSNLPANLAKKEDASDAYARGYALSNALARTFEALDSSFKAVVSDGGQLESCTAGSCVTSIFLTGNLMCCAGLGDCKAAILTLEEAEVPMLTSLTKSGDASTTAEESKTVNAKSTQQFQVTWFSKEHRSSSPKERARIRARGGWFRHGRVGGVLEPTRTIGDFDVKASQPPGVVIATPEVRTFSVTKPTLLLVASDGVWDVMDASQLLRTLKKRRRLWRGILSWLGAPLPERRSLISFGFRRRAKSKEGLESMLQVPTGGDLCAMADTLVTRAHDLGSDDDCTCMCIYLKPAPRPTSEGSPLADFEPGEPDQDLLPDVAESQPRAAPEEEDEDEDEEEDEEELEEEENVEEPLPRDSYSPSADSYSEYEKWRNPAPREAVEEEEEEDRKGEEDEEPKIKTEDLIAVASRAEDWATASFPVATGIEALFPSSSVDVQDAPEVIEKARKRREERRAARERRKMSTGDQTDKDERFLAPPSSAHKHMDRH
eukprot:Protomagalhaensia_sp_Gyna_25__5802@NODE_854_length_2508_cov_23_211017_g674_i0_p1_GENE_NODE_854_length_2508_cov_23_211017_g674_i0NODE_854_length_2508_cov_23_211017_g674_i0_p1_ORF_typecomplete_len624_score107_00PP2C/PF00481_21/2_1e38PP2C_2/PF13672_6/5_6e11SpoIIE/PF07228_12/0_0027BSP_II/PF05432_11/4_1e03BSP_II/PF05432_11/0_023DNA_pol_phi/PF04931_13/4_9CENPB_dimeris/PF09026_10/22CENPB_dimeris/PF09026_10/23_NODE_854_length_2508_cov_23_211017_g674_i04182289